MKIYLFCFTCLCFSFKATSQDVLLTGKILDTLGRFLPNANILAFPETGKTMFSISDGGGNYKLKLSKNITYALEICHLGFAKQSAIIRIDRDSEKNYVLVPAADELDEVILNYKIPILVKKDIIICETDAFVDGEERKLREVLKKLPGVEVDREGNVKVKGKKVTKVLVDGKTFFTGNSKLAVNNITADAVGQIEILDNYSEVSFLKGDFS